MIKSGSFLFYGDAGSGKTAMGVSAFWDYKKLKQVRDGRLITFGREGNDALDVPEELVKRFRSPTADPMKFLTDFNTYMAALIVQLEKGQGPEVIVLDGWTEGNQALLYEYEQRGGDGDKWAKYEEAKDSFFAYQRALDPQEFNIFVIATARVDEKKKGILSRRTGEVTGADPDYMQGYKYIPAMVGWAKKNMAHYYDIVSYVEGEPGHVKDSKGNTRAATLHQYNMIQTGDFLVKNRWEHKWLTTGQPDRLTNPLFDDMIGKLETANEKYAELAA